MLHKGQRYEDPAATKRCFSRERFFIAHFIAADIIARMIQDAASRAPGKKFMTEINAATKIIFFMR
jgi:hypothetical protein